MTTGNLNDELYNHKRGNLNNDRKIEERTWIS